MQDVKCISHLLWRLAIGGSKVGITQQSNAWLNVHTLDQFRCLHSNLSNAFSRWILIDGSVCKEFRTFLGEHDIDAGHGTTALLGAQHLQYRLHGPGILHHRSSHIGICIAHFDHHGAIKISVTHQATRLVESNAMALSVLVIGICVGSNIGDMKGARVNDGDIL